MSGRALTTSTLHQLAAAVGTFHRLSPPIVHRDLKPANILVDLNSQESKDVRLSVQLKITDFGIGGVAVDLRRGADAGAMSPATGVLATSLRGSYTPLYASPQQRTGSPPDPRDDVHALGVIGYHMMTGRLTEAPGIDAVDDLRDGGASERLTAILAKCVASKAERRPADALELAELLKTLAKPGRPASTSPPAEVQSAATAQRPRETSRAPSSAVAAGREKQATAATASGKH